MYFYTSAANHERESGMSKKKKSKECGVLTFTWACLDFLSIEFQQHWPGWASHSKDKQNNKLCVQRRAVRQGKGWDHALLHSGGGEDKKLEILRAARGKVRLDGGKDFWSALGAVIECLDTLWGSQVLEFKEHTEQIGRSWSQPLSGGRRWPEDWGKYL